MNHLAADTLWSFAREELAAEERAQAQLHLDGCAECRASLADVTMATGLLSVLPEPPPMPEAMARRVGHSLAEAADARVAARFTSWWSSLFTPRFVFAAAAGVVLVTAAAWWLAPRQEVAPLPMPVPEQVALPTPPEPVLPELTPPQVAPVKKLSVTVARAHRATTQKAQVLQEGSTIATQVGGSAWLKLPDGSRAGLTSASEVKLATLEEKALTLDVTKGSLALVVPHREDRVLTVRAGEVTVVDLGTRFLVSRDANRTLVAVEEGVVAVKTPAGDREVRAGSAVTWSNGALTEADWEPTPAPAAPIAVAPAPTPEPERESIARLDEEDDDDAPPPPEEAVVEKREEQRPDTQPVGMDEDWAAPPPPNQPKRPAPRVVGVVKPDNGFSIKKLERKLRAAGARFGAANRRDAEVRNITVSADAGDCRYALELIDRWLKAPITSAPSEPLMRRDVKAQQIKCLNRLGRTEEATQLQRQLEPLP
ncbi:MAG: FecR domain-containing protein [Archangium sp.]